MSRLKLITAWQLEKLILALGFVQVRQKGSHVFYRHPDGRMTTIPFHSGKVLPRPLLYTILKEIRVGVEEYNKLLNK